MKVIKTEMERNKFARMKNRGLEQKEMKDKDNKKQKPVDLQPT